jgi:hypothetical protein
MEIGVLMKTNKRNNKVIPPATNTSSVSGRPTHDQARKAARRIEKLRVKLVAAEKETARIRAEAQLNWDILNRAMDFNFASFAGARHRSPVQHPRPIADKLIISAGRAIASAVRKGSSLEHTKAAAVKAASVVANKYGLASVPLDIAARIEGKVQRRFAGVSA